MISCLKEKVNLPTVVTSPIKEVTWEYAMTGGEVIDDGGSPVLSRGVSAYTKWDEPWETVDGAGTGEFTSKIDIRWHGASMSLRDTHYLRAYATNKTGTSYGEKLSFFPKSKPPSANPVRLESAKAKATSATIKYSTEPTPYYSIDEIGICYNTISNPTFEGNHVIVSSTSGSFAFIEIDNLTPNTTYYVKGYVKNESGVSYSQESSFTTWEGEITDVDGNVYQIKTIGSQIWTINNLETTKFNDGSEINLIQEDLIWGSTSTSAYCAYTNYGLLYNYYAVADARNLCPYGWHIPVDEDWKSLERFLGMTQDQVEASGLRGTDEGGKLKYVNKSTYEGWNFPNVGANNSSGFSAFGAGYRNNGGIFTNENTSADFWTKTEYDTTSAWSRSLNLNNAQIARLNIKKGYGFSVRCVKDYSAWIIL